MTVLLRSAVVLRVDEDTCEVFDGDSTTPAGYAPPFPKPRVERVSPGHLVAVATAPDRRDVVVWRWYDAVVLGDDGARLRMWEPAHGYVVAERRVADAGYEPGSRAYLSAGLPGAEWWVAGRVVARPSDADVELAEVERLYTDNGLWESVFGGR